jgi:hypothetical protein
VEAYSRDYTLANGVVSNCPMLDGAAPHEQIYGVRHI